MKKRLRKKLKICCVCSEKVDISKVYGRNGDQFWCNDCINYDY